jgi:hypothetical protein
MTSNKYIIKTIRKGVKVLTINDLKSKKYSLENLLDNDDIGNFHDSLALKTSNSHIIIAATQNKKVNDKEKRSIQVMKKPIAEI